MENLMSKWRSSVEGSKLRQKERKKVQKSLISKTEVVEDTYITSQAERIIDMLFPKDPPHHSKFNQLVEILNEIHIHEKPVQEVSESTSNLLGSLEQKVFESEEKVVALRNENQELKDQVQVLDTELQRNEVTTDLIDLLKSGQKALETTNNALLEDNASLKILLAEREEVWESELARVKETFARLSDK